MNPFQCGNDSKNIKNSMLRADLFRIPRRPASVKQGPIFLPGRRRTVFLRVVPVSTERAVPISIRSEFLEDESKVTALQRVKKATDDMQVLWESWARWVSDLPVPILRKNNK